MTMKNLQGNKIYILEIRDRPRPTANSASLFGMQIEKYLWMTKPQLLVQQCVSQAYQTLQTIIKLIRQYKPWETARLASFQKLPLQSVSILFKFVHPCFLFIAGSIPWDKGEPRGWEGGWGGVVGRVIGRLQNFFSFPGFPRSFIFAHMFVLYFLFCAAIFMFHTPWIWWQIPVSEQLINFVTLLLLMLLSVKSLLTSIRFPICLGAFEMAMKNLQGNKIYILEIRDRPRSAPTAEIKLHCVTPIRRSVSFHVLIFRTSFLVLIVSLFHSFMVFVVNTTDILAHVQSTKWIDWSIQVKYHNCLVILSSYFEHSSSIEYFP